MKRDNCMFGLSAEFADPHDLLEAAKKAKAAGYKKMKGYSPFEVHGLSEVLDEDSKSLYWLILLALIAGVVGAYALQYWTNAVHYPLNVGGRPLNAWPAFTIIMFEAAILAAGIAAAGFMFIQTGLPTPYHPVFNTVGSDGITYDRFFLVIEVRDTKFQLTETKAFLEGLEPINVSEVPC